MPVGDVRQSREPASMFRPEHPVGTSCMRAVAIRDLRDGEEYLRISHTRTLIGLLVVTAILTVGGVTFAKTVEQTPGPGPTNPVPKPGDPVPNPSEPFPPKPKPPAPPK